MANVRGVRDDDWTALALAPGAFRTVADILEHVAGPYGWTGVSVR